MSAREKQMARVMERQAIQDAEKARRGPLALESNRIAVILGVLFIGLPVRSPRQPRLSCATRRASPRPARPEPQPARPPVVSSARAVQVVALLGGFLSGAIPNPLDVCIEGGINC